MHRNNLIGYVHGLASKNFFISKSTVMKKFIQYILLLLAFLAAGTSWSQTGGGLLSEIEDEEMEAINALVLYPEETRLAILEASQYPEALIKIESIQERSQKGFQALLEKYPQEAQETIWDLTRYPNLIERLANLPDASSKHINQVLQDYPEVIHERAEEAVRYHAYELREIHKLNLHAEAAFETLAQNYPYKTQQALRHLLALPEVLSIMSDNIKLTILIGDLYQQNPQWVLHKADSLNLQVARRQVEELQDWKASLENDPEAMEQLEASAEQFKDEYNYYYEDYYDQPFDDVYYEEPEVREVHEYHYYHYPYWFGYPSWYYYPRWRMYPYWYDWGFYYGPGRTVIIVDLPSFYFTRWYFYHPYHHYRWSHLSAHFTQHYYTHRRHGSSITAGVTVWKNENPVVTDEWLRNDGQLKQRFREFGQFEADRASYNRRHPQEQVTQREFEDKNIQRYRAMSEVTQKTRSATRPEAQPGDARDDKTKIQPRDRKIDPTKVNPRIPVVPKKTEPREKIEIPRTKIPTVKKGAERHRSILEKNKSTRTRTVNPSPPRTKKTKTTTTKTKSNKNR